MAAEASLRGRVLAASTAARAAGVRPGQSVRQAQQLCPGAAVVPLDLTATRRLRTAVLGALGGVVPRLEVGDEEAWGDLGGRHARYSDELAWAVAAARAVTAALGDPPRGGIAGSRFVAGIAARQSPPRRVRRIPPGEEGAFLAPLPVSLLPAAPDLLARLTALGIDRLGQLAALAPGDLAAQFGPAGLEIRRLARGEDGGDLHRGEPPVALAERLVFEVPLGNAEVLHRGVRLLCDRLGEALRRRGLAATRLRLALETDEPEEATVVGVPPVPLGGPADLWSMALSLLRVVVPRAPVGAIRLEAVATVRAGGRQGDFWRRGVSGGSPLAGALVHLGDRYGRSTLLRPRLALDPGDLPERRFGWIPAIGAARPEGKGVPPTSAAVGASQSRWPGSSPGALPGVGAAVTPLVVRAPGPIPAPSPEAAVDFSTAVEGR